MTYISFEHLLLFANACQVVSWIASGANSRGLSTHGNWLPLSINAISGVIEALALDGLLKVEVAFRNMLLYDGPTTKYKNKHT